ncbi:hypothetical protein, partial [Roseiconus lacunae]
IHVTRADVVTTKRLSCYFKFVGPFTFECGSDPTPVVVTTVGPIASLRHLCLLVIALDVTV